LNIKNLVNKIHSSSFQGCFSITGGGMKIIDYLFQTPGSSKTILEILIPYSKNSLSDFLSNNLDSHVSHIEAIDMAEKSYLRSRALSNNSDIFGLSCTAAISTNRLRKGDDRAFIAWNSKLSNGYKSVLLEKSRRKRVEEDIIISKIILNTISKIIGINEYLNIDLYESEKIEEYNY
tara:strand:+ start:14733 stop:15263 length:531 start_codon:yes stop_codon:yes gene_type:complete